MAGLIVSRQAKKPYFIREIGLHIYSAEELSYFLQHYIAIVEKNFFSDELCDYIRNTLGLDSVASRIVELRGRKGGVNDIVMLIAKASGYYSESELISLQSMLDGRKNASDLALIQQKADKLTEIGQYYAAAHTYQECIAKELSINNPEFFGQIFYHLGCIQSRMLQLEEAEQSFEESLARVETRSCLEKLYYVYRLEQKEEAIARMPERWNVSAGMLREWDNHFRKVQETVAQKEAEPLPDLNEIKAQYRREHEPQREMQKEV